jgi:hypothetical protein
VEGEVSLLLMGLQTLQQGAVGMDRHRIILLGVHDVIIPESMPDGNGRANWHVRVQVS